MVTFQTGQKKISDNLAPRCFHIRFQTLSLKYKPKISSVFLFEQNPKVELCLLVSPKDDLGVKQTGLKWGIRGLCD